jgi:hypothetical protein
MLKTSLSWLTAAAILLGTTSAFIVPSNIRGNQAVTNQIRSTLAETTTSLFAEKKRRRRKDASSDPSAQTDEEEDELPDFDLVADIDVQEQAAAKAAAAKAKAAAAEVKAGAAASRGKSFDINSPEVMAAMRAKKGGDVGTGAASTKDLLRSRNRELEDKLMVNAIKEEVPSLADYAKKTKADGSKKALKRETRRQAALEREGEIVVEEESLLSKFPFLLKVPFATKFLGPKVEEEKTPVKVSQKR